MKRFFKTVLAFSLFLSVTAFVPSNFGFFFVGTFAPPAPPAWQMGSAGDLNLSFDTLSWDTDAIYDYNSVTLDNVVITITGSPTGKPPVIGSLHNFTMTNCVVIGTDNEDGPGNFYDFSGAPLPKYNYTKTPSGGPTFSFDMQGSQGGRGGSDNAMGSHGGMGLWGSGGGGGANVDSGNGFDASSSAGGNGADGDINPGGGGGSIFANGGSDGGGGITAGGGGGGGALALSGQNIMFAIWGSVTAFSGNMFNLNGSDGVGGGAGGIGNAVTGAGGGGGGGSAGGSGGLAQWFLHIPSALITSDQFNLVGGVGGSGGIGGTGALSGNDGDGGSNGVDGSLQVGSY